MRHPTALSLLLLCACGGSDDGVAPDGARVLRFSAIPDQNETELREKFAPVADYLSERLGIPVEYVHATNYSDSVELFKNGDIQLAWFGGLSGVQARAAVPGARAIAQGKADPQFYSYFIAHVDSGLEPSETFPLDLEGKTFTFGDRLSTSGRPMPEYFIRQHTGRAPEEFFGRENNYSGTHDATCELVESGQFAAGAVNYKVYDKRVASGQTDPAVCRVIWKTPPYADYNLTAHPVLESYGDGFVERLQRALIEIDDPDLLAAFQREALIPATNEDFESIEALAGDLGFLRG